MNVTVVVPVYNGAETLRACLDALRGNAPAPQELIVVDDRSTDNGAAIAAEYGAHVIPNTHNKGPAGARNEGALHATGDILLFVDADVVVRPDTIAHVLREFQSDAGLSALFGSYDTQPGATNFLSQYKNLFHHYVHQNSSEISGSFWAGCGAIRAGVFHELGGFDENTYRDASIEDIELGLRMSRKGLRVKLAKELQVCHLKKWTPMGLLKADILRRAVPWTRLMASAGSIPNDLNLRTSQRVSAILAAIFAISVVLLPVCIAMGRSPLPALSVLGLSGAGIVALNLDFYRFFVRLRGLLFTTGVFAWHILYYLYSSATFALLWIHTRAGAR